MPIDTSLASSLREKLGSESAGKWIEFMDSLGSSLPFVLRGAGRPTSEEIASSAIGKGGFRSWREMIEYSPAFGGLGWSYDTYKAWKKAYSLILKYPYLRDLSLSSSEINTIQRENEQFPTTLEAFKELKEKKKDSQEERRLNSITSLQKQLSAATKEVATLKAQLETSRVSADQFKSLSEQLRKELAISNEKNGALQVQLERSNHTVKRKNQKIEIIEKRLDNLQGMKRAHEMMGNYLRENIFKASRWQLFLSFLRGNVRKPPKEASIENIKS